MSNSSEISLGKQQNDQGHEFQRADGKDQENEVRY